MPYEYWKLSQEERERIISYRRERGYPLHAPPHPYREAGCYLITAANYRHQSVMEFPERRTEFELLLLESMKEIHAEALAWVVLPNHYHILINVDTLNAISSALKTLHGRTSREWNLKDHLTERRRVWYKFSDRRMRSEKQLLQAIDYIHFNPVKHGLTDTIFQWPWSSLHLCHEAPVDPMQKQLSVDVTQDFGRGWDD